MSTPGHLMPFSDPDWAVWRWCQVRSAGFPFAQVDEVADPASASAADDVVRCDRLTEEAAGAADAVLSAAVGARLEDVPVGTLHDALRSLRRGRTVAAVTGLPESVRTAVSVHTVLEGLGRDSSGRFQEVHAEGVRTEARVLVGALAEPRFQEALVWQNPAAFSRVRQQIGRLEPDRPGWAPRKRERADLMLVHSYLQRYCAKNDTIGFFGPVAWTRLDPQAGRLTLSPGRDLVARRTVRWESWGIEALAGSLAADPSMTPWLVPRLRPLVTVTDNAALQPMGPDRPLTKDEAQLLRACDGTRTVRDLTAGAEARRSSWIAGELERWRQEDLLHLGLPVPLTLDPDESLAGRLNRVRDEAARGRAQQALAGLRRARREVAEAAGDPDRLAGALSALGQEFTHVTGEVATRGQGQFYAARSLVYEECTRDMELGIGDRLITDLESALGLLMLSGRWLCRQVVRVVELVLRQQYRKAAARHGTVRVPLADVWLASQRLLFAPDQPLLAPVLTEFHRRWAAVLGDLGADSPGRRTEIAFRSEELEPAVRRQFGGAGAPVRAARHHSPDLLLDAPSVEAVERGDYTVVLGEVHLACNTLLSANQVGEHPRPGELADAWRHDLGRHYTRVTPAREWNFTVRTTTGVHPDDHRELVVARDSVPARPERAVRLGDLTVREQEDGELVAEDGTGTYRQPLLEALGEAVAPLMSNLFGIAAPVPYRPRLRIDRLVVSRRGWRLGPEDCSFAGLATPAERYLALRRTADVLGLPRRVFVRVPAELKPVYVDLESLSGVEILCKLLRKESGEVSLSEMLPGPEGMWLKDAQGGRYSSELRIAMVDISGAEQEEDPREWR
ncbi:lantibiotic dehydratase [Streptomyces tendae]|uniref:lantibiotic dehydratase n=1 Tax=Streptomyces tendae TaxID=1932 RepID=UPI0036AF4D22